MNILEINNLRKSFGNTKVLKDISLRVEEGQILSIIGPSGSGKSTLLRCATMLDVVDSGSISYFGDSLVTTEEDGLPKYPSKEEQKKIQNYFGMVFQNFNLFPHFSVIRNIVDPLIISQKANKEDAYKIAEELLKRMGLSDKSKAFPCELSGGQQQRVSIARALALNPKILFFDEPTSALDPELTGEVLEIIKDLAAEDITMVIVTHEIEFARDVSDYVIFMDDGAIVEEGIPSEVLEMPKNERTKTFLNRFNS